MSNVKSKLSNRLIAAFLSVIMVIGMIPMSAMPAFAATDKHPNVVTITITDDEGAAIEGATVVYTVDSVANGADYISESKITDQYGCVEVFPADEFNDVAFAADDFTLKITSVSKDGYKLSDEDKAKDYLVDAAITSQDQDFAVSLISTSIKDVTISANSGLVYNGNPQTLVSINGTKTNDTVIFNINDEDDVQYKVGTDPEVKIEKTDAKDYAVTVTIQRDGYTDKIEEFDVSIAKADIDITITGKTVPYSETEQDLVEWTDNTVEGDTIQWYVDGEEETVEPGKVPQRKPVGTYSVRLVVTRDDNYNVLDKTVSAEIQLANLALGDLSISANELTYDGTDQKALTVEKQGSYTLEYSFDGANDWIAFTNDTDYPTVKDAGSYTIYVRAIKEGYNNAQYPTYPISVKVAKAEQSGFKFAGDSHAATGNSSVTIVGSPGADGYGDQTFKFNAEDPDNFAKGEITYKVEFEKNTDGLNIDEYATIDDDGTLHVYFPETFIITASLSGNENYYDKDLTYTLTVSTVTSEDGELIKFKENEGSSETVSEVAYILGSTALGENVVSLLQAYKDNGTKDNGTVKYSIDRTNIGLDINENTGKITVSDYSTLADALIANGGELKIQVTANKTKSTRGNFAADHASYILTISFMNTPSDPYKIDGTIGTNDWYTSEITVSASDVSAYSVSKECSPSKFADSVVFDDEGTNARYIFLRDKTSGGITTRLTINIKIDTLQPDVNNMSIEFGELNAIEKIGKFFGFYNPTVDIKFTIADETNDDESGVDHITWTYIKDADATSSILASKTGILSVSLEDGKYVATLTLTADEAEQYRGNISFTATDVAGNTSGEKADDGTIIVVDTITPTMDAAHELVDQTNGIYNLVGNQHYYNGDVKFTFTIKEANFFDEDVVIKVTRDNADYSVIVDWSVDPADDETHIGTFTLSGDGDYIVSMTYADQSGNKVADYKSDVITIDTIPPVIEFVYDRNAQTITVTVIEHNFRATDLVVTGAIKDIKGIDVIGFTAEQLTAILQGATWTQAGDKYTCELSKELENGIFDLAFDYKDISGNDAETNEPDVFIIDHDKPYNVKIEYNKSILDTVLETLTLGFYKPDVTVTFTAYDDDGGVETFSWNYTQQTGTSSVNLAADSGVLTAVPDESDKSKFTASITLTATEAEQLRGYISVSATDTFNNTSDTITDDGYILVVDTISPTMTASYSQEDRMVGANAFYKGDATVTFRVTEANFFAEDVVVKITKDGGAPVVVTPSWIDESVDVHVGTLILGDGIQDSNDANVASVGDGDYVITVEYTDRSTNKMESYTSHVVTIDTIKPVIDVQYHNNNVINTLTDSEDNTREYYDAVQTATVKVTEHNFNADEVEFTIIGKDVTGAELNTANLYSASSWTTNGDVHTITLTYSGDANYTFDVAYTDLATNPADDYAEDYFTVDQTKPTNLTVSYSTSVLDTILENITFGFYNAEMTVTITADDSTSSVHEFKYSYLNAAGVSSVNAELVNELIEESAITYSNGGRTATAEFKIPKMVLGNDNQFNGIVEFTATDRSGNESDTHTESHRVVVDNIAPNATVEYNDPVRTEGDISYYDGDVEVTVTITEANFYAEDVSVMVSKDGAAATAVTPTWRDNSVDVHVGTFTLTEDGDYIITITYRDKSSNEMNAYESNQLTIDTEIEAPTIILKGLSAQGVTDAEIIGTENDTIYAFKDAIVPSVSFSDQNFDDYNITLTQVQRASERSWSKQDLSSYISVADKAGDGDISLFALDKGEAERKLDDGIYQLTVSMTDKVDHSSESTVTFTVNRFGSVYKYSDALVQLITSGGAYATWEKGVFMIRSEELIVGELTITEYNANRIVDGSLNIDITRDGRSVTNKQIDTPAGTGNGRENWFEYQYLISGNNFTEDGTYRITISSEDEAKNTPESVPDNSIAENNDAIVDTILFRVDSTVPEITSIAGLENRIINDQTVDVRYTVYDAIGLKSVTVYVNGTAVQTVDSFNDLNNYSNTFTINESNSEQTVRILVEDLAGNVTDSDRFGETDADGNVVVPMPAYSFNRSVTVSTNFFVRWYANQPLFWGSIGGVVVLAGAIWFLIAFLRKKKKGDEK